MKKLTKRVASLLSVGCAAFLGLFHTSCHLIGGVEYGTPYMEYDVKVKVQSPDGKPIEGIEVAVVRKYHTEEGDRIVKLVTPVQTNSSGIAQISQASNLGGSGNKLYVQAVDVDGVKNGRWATKVDSIPLFPSDIQSRKPKKRWCMGVLKKGIAVTMDPAQDETPSK